MNSCLLSLLDIFSFCLHSPSPLYLALCLAHSRGLVKVSQLNQRQDNLILEGKIQLTCKGTETKWPIGKILGKYHLGCPSVGGGGGAWGWGKQCTLLSTKSFFKLQAPPVLPDGTLGTESTDQGSLENIFPVNSCAFSLPVLFKWSQSEYWSEPVY